MKSGFVSCSSINTTYIVLIDEALTRRHQDGADRDRTDDPRLAKPVLSQLSYSPR